MFLYFIHRRFVIEIQYFGSQLGFLQQVLQRTYQVDSLERARWMRTVHNWRHQDRVPRIETGFEDSNFEIGLFKYI